MTEVIQKGLDEKFCGECGGVIKVKAEICPKCGVRQFPVKASDPLGQSGRSRIVAALLAMFLGSLGMHKFYLGQTWQGVFRLLFFWTLIPGIIAFFEAIRFLLMTDEAFAEKYGSA